MNLRQRILLAGVIGIIASALLGISRRTLQRKLSEMNRVKRRRQPEAGT